MTRYSPPASPRWLECRVCGGWLKRDCAGVYRHSRLDSRACQTLATRRLRMEDTRSTPQLCLWCGLDSSACNPVCLCPSCAGKYLSEQESQL